MEELVELRTKIDELDKQWLTVLSERFKVTREVGKLKASGNLPSVDPNRESEQFAHLAEKAQELDVSPQLACDILRRIIDEVVISHEAQRAQLEQSS